MRKQSKQIWFTGVLLCLLMVLSASQVRAADVRKSITLKQNKEVTLKAIERKKKTNYHYYYKLSIPGDGFITLTIRGKSGTRFCYYLFRKLSKASSFCFDAFVVKGKTAIQIPMDKGTVYLSATQGYKVKWKFTKVAVPSNYSPDTAMSLKKGKKIKVCQTPKYSFDRWFKVALTKKQRITFWAEAGRQVSVYNEDLDETYDVERAGSQSLKYCTSESLEAGTYYLCMSEMDNTSYGYNERFYYSSFYWK